MYALPTIDYLDEPKKKVLPVVAEEPIDINQPPPIEAPVVQPPMESYFSDGLPAITAPTEPIAAPVIPPTASDAPVLPVIGADPIETELAAKTAELTEKSQYKDKKWSKWDKIAAALEGWAKGGIFGAIGAVKDPHYFERQRIERDRADLLPQIGALTELRKANQAKRVGDVQIKNIIDDNTRQEKQAKDLKDWRDSETARKTDDRISRERTSRMTAVAGMFKNVPVYDPADPKFKELTDALGDVGLPLTPKDAKKKVDLKQDQRTGAWTVILTDPISGKQEVRNVVKDGKPFASTPTVVMQGEYGMLKQDDQQEHQAGQAQIQRQFQLAIKQFDVANGRVKTLETAANQFKAEFFKKNNRNPSQQEVNAYLDNVVIPALQ